MAKDEAAAKLLVDRYPSLLENAIRTPPDAEGIWMIRPYGYVAAVTHGGDWKTIEESLDRIALKRS
jgi:hypothetical protein